MEINPKGFEAAIKAHLDQLAATDKAFAANYAKPAKSIEECCKYIIQEVEKGRQGNTCVACLDTEVYGLAIHYYDEDSIVVSGPKTKAAVAAPAQTATTPAKPKRTRKKAAKAEPQPAPDTNLPDELIIPVF